MISKEKNTVLTKFEKALSEFDMLSDRNSVLVGFSGGPDSTLLLTLLSEFPGIKVYAAHLNHMIRGPEADRDENFCRDFCAERKIPIFVLKENIPLISEKSGTGLEETARNIRYSFFNRIACENNIDCIATAHNSSDNAETIIFNLIRGSGTNGLCGIPPVRNNIIRPLILCSKQEIISECKRRNINYVYDSTNSDTDYTRNYIRHKIIPLIRELNPSFENAISETAYLHRKDKDYFSSITENISFSAGRKRLAELDDALLGRVLVRELKKAGLSPEFEHIRKAEKLIRSKNVRFSISMPRGSLICDRNEISTETGDSQPVIFQAKVLSTGLNYLSPDSAVFIANNSEDYSKYINKLKNIYKLSIHTSFDSAKINGVLFARSRTNGDNYIFGGMKRNIKKLFQSKKLTLKERQKLPVFAIGKDILWIPGFPVSDQFKPSAKNSQTDIFYFSGKINL